LPSAPFSPSTLAAYVYPIFGELPVAAVDVGLVMKAVEPIWTVANFGFSDRK
jgi:hypothetical protein